MTGEQLREKKYQLIRLYSSGKITLAQLKAAFRIVSVATIPEYAANQDINDVLETIGRMDKYRKMSKTRDIARQEALLRFKPDVSKFRMSREEHIAKFATGYGGEIPHNWKRYGVLVAKGKRKNEPRIGSSKGKVARTRFRGFRELNKDLRMFEQSLLQLIKSGKKREEIKRRLDAVRKGVRVSVEKRT